MFYSIWMQFKIFKKVSFVIILLIAISGFFTKALVNPEFQANYEIWQSWDKILDDFVKLEASSKVGKDPDLSIFKDLYENFQKVFPNLPQKKTYKIVYEQCNLLVQDLMNWYSYTKFTNFQNNCQKEINKVMKEINNSYTVKAKVKVSPQQWPAPLTVTLDARDSIDPSSDTIPSENYYWWYKDNKWVDREIGKGSVLYYTFPEEGKYYVHLTVRSANHKTKWILDWSTTFTVDVSPKSANIVVYVGWQKMKEGKYTKVWIKEARKWLVFDWSATTAKWWRKILYHYWQITNDRWFKYATNKKNWKPDTIKVSLPDNWEYAVTLTTIDNENNKVSQTFLLKISDPIAIITADKTNWNTSMEFKFDGNKSYSIQSRVKLYTWEIYNDKWDKIYTEQKPEITKKFDKPWIYIVKLTVTDEAWEKDQDTVKINVESTPPEAQFTIKPLSQWEYPSQFILDASNTTDVDVSNWYDHLSYKWTFSDNNYAKIDKSYDNWKRVIVSFDKKWKYQITLEAKDAFGKTSKITKDVEIKSSLRPVIIVSPKAASWWKTIIFVAKSNKEIMNYEWDFGDWISRTVQTNSIRHKYEEAWTYQVKLKATARDWEENTITTLVFIWEKDKPIVAYKVKDKLMNIMRQKDFCEIKNWSWEKIKIPAYKIDRYEDFTLDISDSVNVKWKKSDLKSYFQPEWWEIYTKQVFKYHFSDLWCQYVDVFVEDTKANKTDHKRVWFKVYNALPTLEKIQLKFPQYWNEIWVWLQTENTRVNILSDKKFDPLIVKVEAIGATDPDWSISYFTRYYYDKNNPDHIFESRISPWNAPYAYFSLPKTIPGEYVFGVRMTDNDWWQISSEEIIWQSAVIPIFPDEKNLDVPMVSLVEDKLNIKVWDEVTFTVKSKILSQRKDFEAKKTNKFDFDWDWTIDLITKDDVVKHVYKKPHINGVIPKVEVVYRWYKWTAFGEKIIVKNWLKPVLLYTTIDKTLLLRDNSIWDITKKTICFDHNLCKKDESFKVSQWNAFIFEYPDYWQYVLEYHIEDDFGNKITERHLINLKKDKSDKIVQLVSIPEAKEIKWEPVIRVWNSLDNSVLMYIKYKWVWDCYVDTDIWKDSDWDWIADNDRDLECNQPNKLVKYDPNFDKVVWKIYYDDMSAWWLKKMMTQTFTVKFIDYNVKLSPQEQEKYDEITDIIKKIDSSITWNQNLLAELLKLRNSLWSNADVADSVVTLYWILEKDNDVKITKEVRNQIERLLESLSNAWVVAALWWWKYEQAKQEILSILPPNLKTDVKPYFQQIDDILKQQKWSWDLTDATKDKIKTLLNNIIQRISKNTVVNYDEQWENDILKDDFDLVIQPQICEIANYYKIKTKTCWGFEEKVEKTSAKIVKTTNTWLSSILKRILIVGWVVLLLFVLTIIYFAIKARQTNEEDEEEEEE